MKTHIVIMKFNERKQVLENRPPEKKYSTQEALKFFEKVDQQKNIQSLKTDSKKKIMAPIMRLF